VSWFDLSPDGTQILFRHPWDSTEIMIADADGGQPRLLVPASTLKQRSVSWLPSGEVWVVDGTSKDNWKIWAVDPHTGERAHPRPRPDVPEIAFVPTSKEGQVPMWGQICRVRYGNVLERLTPERDRYVRILMIKNDTVVAFRMVTPDFWDTVVSWLASRTAPEQQFELVTLKVVH